MNDVRMNLSGDVASTSNNQEELVHRAKLDNLFNQVRISVYVNIILAITICWSYLHTVPMLLLSSWLISLSATNIYRWTLASRYVSGDHDAALQVRTREFLAWTLASGILWGLSVPLFLPYADRMDQQFLLIIAVAGLASRMSARSPRSSSTL